MDQFQLNSLEPDFTKIEEAFTYFYLVKMYEKTILKEEEPYDRFEAMFRKNPNMRICSKENARKLIQLYFIDLLK